MAKLDLKNIDMTAKFTNFQVINKDFTRCRCNVFYTGRNRNYSDITEEALQKFITKKGFANVPVVAHLMKDDDGKYYIGGHDSKIVIDNNGIEFVNECVPFGVIPEDCNPSMDLIIERSGEQRKYFSVDIILWTHRYPIMKAAYSDEIYFNQSMEVFFEDYKYDNDYVVVNDFSMSALCLLRRSMDANENIEPCFESSRVKAFSIDTDQFKQNFDLMLEKLKEFESDGTTTTVQNNETNNNPQMGGESKMEFVRIAEALSKSDDNCKYRLLNVTENKVFALDLTVYKPYGFDYVITKTEDVESIIIDFESKTEMSLSATDKITKEDFDEFNIKNEIDAIKEDYAKSLIAENTKKISESLSKEFKQDYDKLKESYDTLTESYKLAADKLAVFEKKEAELKERAHKEEIDNLVNTYAEKLGKYSKFLVYKAQIEEHYSKSIDEVRQDLIFMAGNYLTSQENSLKRNFSYTPTDTGVNGKRNETTNNKYGHLLDKYIK